MAVLRSARLTERYDGAGPRSGAVARAVLPAGSVGFHGRAVA